jgi:NAD(P) transhydrogenase
MSRFDYDLICIGSGPAGQRAAVQAAKLGRRVAVVERQRWVGGVCVDKGTIPSKAFREAVILHTGYGRRFIAQQGKSTGSPILSENLIREVGEVVRNEGRIVEQQLRRNNIQLIRGIASLEDRHTVKVTTESACSFVKSDIILLAVGSCPELYPGHDCDRDVIVTSDDLPFLKSLPRTMTVVGAGVIGIEYASIFATLGIEVTVINRRDQLLEFLDHEIVLELMKQMRGMNVTFHLGESVVDINTVGASQKSGLVRLESGKEIVGDIVLYSIGRIGATDELHLENVGLKTDSLGRIKVNEFFQTDILNIYAAGDVIGFPSLAATSSEQGRLASRHAFKGDINGMEKHFPIGIYAIPEISMVGKSEQELIAQKIPYETGIAHYSEIARGQILGDNSGLLKMLFERETRQLLGVHAIGTGATELIHVGQAVLRLGGGLDYFLHTVFNYPTLTECYKVAAWDAENKFPL